MSKKKSKKYKKYKFPKHGDNCKFVDTMCKKCYIEYIEWSCRD